MKAKGRVRKKTRQNMRQMKDEKRKAEIIKEE